MFSTFMIPPIERGDSTISFPQPFDDDASSTSFFGEFGNELLSVIPYAYWLHLQDKLSKTEGAIDTKCMYYFSQNHIECDKKRSWILPETPNWDVHAAQLNTRQWCPPPYKDFYQNDRFKFEKPLLIIHNKYTAEWESGPINYIGLKELKELFECFSPYYSIIYIRPSKYCIETDHQDIFDWEDFALLKQYPEVISFQQLVKTNSDISFNHLQMLIHAKCKNFISVQGGNSVLASYFGGTNLILAIKGKELIYNAFEHFYHLLSGCSVRSFNDGPALVAAAKKMYL